MEWPLIMMEVLLRPPLDTLLVTVEPKDVLSVFLPATFSMLLKTEGVPLFELFLNGFVELPLLLVVLQLLPFAVAGLLLEHWG